LNAWAPLRVLNHYTDAAQVFQLKRIQVSEPGTGGCVREAWGSADDSAGLTARAGNAAIKNAVGYE